MESQEIIRGVASVLSTVSSYTQARIIELMKYSDNTYLQLINIMSASDADVLADKIHRKFLKVDQQKLYDKLFKSIKTAEALVEYVYGHYKGIPV